MSHCGRSSFLTFLEVDYVKLIVENIRGGRVEDKGNVLGKVYLIVFLTVFSVHMIFLLLAWDNIPSKIGIHYTNGKADGFGSKYVLFLLPVISLITWASLGFVKKRPEKLNYLNLTEQNKEIQYMKGKQLMTHLPYFTALSIVFMNDSFLKEAMGENHTAQLTIAITLVGICVLMPFIYMIWSVRLKV